MYFLFFELTFGDRSLLMLAATRAFPLGTIAAGAGVSGGTLAGTGTGSA